MMKTYRVYVEIAALVPVDVIANNEEEAENKIQSLIDKNKFDEQIGNEVLSADMFAHHVCTDLTEDLEEG